MANNNSGNSIRIENTGFWLNKSKRVIFIQRHTTIMQRESGFKYKLNYSFC